MSQAGNNLIQAGCALMLIPILLLVIAVFIIILVAIVGSF